MLVHFLMGDLPWRGLKYTQKDFEQRDKSKTLLDRVCEKKLTTSFLDSCPPEFHDIHQHIRSLKYEGIPNYELLIHLLLTMLNKTGAAFDYQYDWTKVRRLALYKRQVERKRKILDELLDSRARPLLLLQAHRIQFMQDDPARLPSMVSVPSATAKKVPGTKEEGQKPEAETDVEAQKSMQKVPSVKQVKPEKELFRRFSLREEKD
ncbi:hypothetical protein RvY_06190-1 [Ramazzottius varieornatus]|uniref:Non-specific serine/threonine protein kinase n=1 Tax=Ramazzottius varieornatus TaxID=947166 RepID=A0A1D1V365_RAMVA|nr:hypothetical protein RvY_06190-1 [Ramazzottius varieornatus]